MTHRDTALQALDNAHAVDIADGSALYYAQRGTGYATLALADAVGELIELLRPWASNGATPAFIADTEEAIAVTRPRDRGHFERLAGEHEPHCTDVCFGSDHLVTSEPRVHAHSLQQAKFCATCVGRTRNAELEDADADD